MKPAQIIRLPRVKHGPAAAIGRLWQSAPRIVSRWRRWMAMSIPLPHVLGYVVLILGTLLVFWVIGYHYGHQGVNGSAMTQYIQGARLYQIAANSMVDGCWMDREQRRHIQSGGRIENILERRK